MGSIAVHGLVLALLALPRIEAFPDRSNDEDALIVTLERIDRTAESQPDDQAASAALRQIQPRTPRAIFRTSVTPLFVPGAPAEAPRGTAAHPAPLPGGSRGDLRSALRGSGVGCANATAVGLNRRELERCHERWGEAARTAPVYANAPLSAGATAGFASQAARQEADRRYRAAPMAPGIDHRSRDGLGQAKDIPFVMGDTDGVGRKKSDQSLGVRP